MILVNETYEEYGYWLKDLSEQSHKKVIASCDGCGKIRRSRRDSYRKLCISCAELGRVLTEKHRKAISEGTKGIKNHGYGKHHSEEHKAKQRKSQNEFYSALTEEEFYKRYCKENHSQWKGGIRPQYCTKFNNDFKERVREFFNRKCVNCGKSEEENGQKLAVHHVNYEKMVCCNNIEPLFVSLCRNCHSKTNHNRKYWEEFFTKLIKEKYNDKCYYTKKEYYTYNGKTKA